MLVKCKSLIIEFVFGCRPSWQWRAHLNQWTFLNLLRSKVRRLISFLLLPEDPMLADLLAEAQAVVYE